MNLSFSVFALGVFVLSVARGVFAAQEHALTLIAHTKDLPPGKRRRRQAKYLTSLTSSLSDTILGLRLLQLFFDLILGFLLASWFVSLHLYQVLYESPLLMDRLGVFTIFVGGLILLVSLAYVLGETIPNSLASRYPHVVTYYFAWFTWFFVVPFGSFSRLLMFLSEFVLTRIVGLGVKTYKQGDYNSLHIANVMLYAEHNEELDKEDEKLIHGVLSFGDSVVREVMTPRTDIEAIPIAAGLNDAVSLINNSGYSRYPVIGENQDDVLGVVLAKDILARCAQTQSSSGSSRDFSIRSLMREAYFIPGTKAVSDLLGELKRRKTHMAIVLDEHGGVDGLVTLEDLLETIVGEIFDESDDMEQYVRVDPEGNLLVDGSMLVADLNSRLGVKIPEGEYDTIAGYVFTTLGRMPESQERIFLDSNGRVEVVLAGSFPGRSPEGNEAGDYEVVEYIVIEVDRITGHRIEQVKITTKKSVKTSGI